LTDLIEIKEVKSKKIKDLGKQVPLGESALVIKVGYELVNDEGTYNTNRDETCSLP
jgi:hypothetical protein